MNQRDKDAVAAARKKTARSRAGDVSQENNDELKDKLKDVADVLKNKMKSQIVSSAVRGALSELAAGDFGSLSDISHEDIDSALEAQFQILGIDDINPKYYLQQDASTLLLSPTLASETKMNDEWSEVTTINQ